MRYLTTSLAIALSIVPASATARPIANPQINFVGFQRLTARVASYRAKRLVNFKKFSLLAKQPNTLILDARSKDAFARGHIRGAVNLPFTDFTAQSLARVIGNSNRPILIYCNNNFRNNRSPVPLKRIDVALNIQTFINLLGMDTETSTNWATS